MRGLSYFPEKRHNIRDKVIYARECVRIIDIFIDFILSISLPSVDVQNFSQHLRFSERVMKKLHPLSILVVGYEGGEHFCNKSCAYERTVFLPLV